MPWQINYNTNNLEMNFYIYKFTPYMTTYKFPLEPETNGFNNQIVLNVISMANALEFGFLVKKTFAFDN